MMTRRVATILAIAFSAASTHAEARIKINGQLPSIECTPSKSVCGVTIHPGNLVFTDDDGHPASLLNNFVFSVVQFVNPDNRDAPPITNSLVNYDQYNRTQNTVAGGEQVYIRFFDNQGNALDDVVTIGLMRYRCRDLGHQVQGGNLTDIFKKGAFKFEITQQTLANPIDVC